MFLKVSASPHIRTDQDTAYLMKSVCMALMPAVVMATIIFGPDALVICAASTAFAVFFEWLCRKWMKRENTTQDWSAAVTGLLLGLNMPVTIPLWMLALGDFFAIAVVKQAFGGLGKNFVNPALAARVFMLLSFPGAMTNFALRPQIMGVDLCPWLGSEPAVGALFPVLDLISTATPLAMARAGETVQPWWQLFLGFHNGVIGEVSGLALLIGGIILLARGVIEPIIPFSYIATTLIFVACCGQDPLAHLMSGGLLLGAFFMATDYVTNPITREGKLIFGIGCGLITGLIRIWGSCNEGVSYAILFMNILSPHIDRWTNRFPKKQKARLELDKGGK